MLGKLADQNLATTATISGTGWASELPLANMLKEDRYILQPARCMNPADLTKSQCTVTLAKARAISLVALLFHTLSVGARYRVTIIGPGGDFAAPDYDSGWTAVFSRVYHSSAMAWEDPGFWLGQLSTEELKLYAPHLWIPLPSTLASSIRIEFDDVLNGDGFFDIGGLHLASTFTPTINFERGRDLSRTPRDLVDEGPSGRKFAERRPGRRQLSLTWSALRTVEAYRMFDAGARAGIAGTVIFLPDADDPISLLREAFPATFATQGPGSKLLYSANNTVATTLSEILG